MGQLKQSGVGDWAVAWRIVKTMARCRRRLFSRKVAMDVLMLGDILRKV